ncbi:hypothetical protein PHLGIDRAFT_237772 [Phlebiopsis gigantea 11061_1 CR5-6]|uniref:Uncharacterized protein n=1 Tax=Phlebiopsis gigantea (strain 11061_1 CR5-6) TaxID=745531 RepID=A0A0C3RSQ1_PHLG1|nr:hypothetical protein PHLGIDRAFT_237772 [Phlebiopsis gigantea 11061_1 CR5-6]
MSGHKRAQLRGFRRLVILPLPSNYPFLTSTRFATIMTSISMLADSNMILEGDNHPPRIVEEEHNASLVTETHERDIEFSCTLFGTGPLAPSSSTRTKGIKLTAALLPFLCTTILDDPDILCHMADATSDGQTSPQAWIQWPQSQGGNWFTIPPVMPRWQLVYVMAELLWTVYQDIKTKQDEQEVSNLPKSEELFLMRLHYMSNGHWKPILTAYRSA